MRIDLISGNCVDILKTLPPKSVQCCVTSPPYYGLRDYGVDGQIGLEQTPEEYVAKLVSVFRLVRDVLRDDGSLWLNLGDSYTPQSTHKAAPGTRGGINAISHDLKDKMNMHRYGKPKDLMMIPARVALALQADGWYLRSDIIWAKPNPMPESVKDRPTRSHEYIFLLTKKHNYYYDYKAILEPANYDGRRTTRMRGSKKYQNGFAPTDDNPNTLHLRGHERWPLIIGRTERKINCDDLRGHSGYYDENGKPRFNAFPDGVPARNKRDVWVVPTKPYKGAHFATFPPDLIKPCVLAGSREGDTVLDPFCGAGTTMLVAAMYGRNGIGIDINQSYINLSKSRIVESGVASLLDINVELAQ